jgi:hypothetical protein
MSHISYTKQHNHLFSWRYPKLACKTKDICISKQENKTYFDETKNFFVRFFCACFSGDVPCENMYMHVIHCSCRARKTFAQAHIASEIPQYNGVIQNFAR